MTQIPSLPPPAIFRKGEREYRRWTKEHKRQIVEESFTPGVSVSVVARKHDVNTNQVFKWRQEYQRGELSGEAKGGEPAGLVSVGTIGQDGRLVAPPVPSEPAPLPLPASPATPHPATSSPQGIIEVVLRQGIRVRCKGNVDLPTLHNVIRTVASLP